MASGRSSSAASAKSSKSDASSKSKKKKNKQTILSNAHPSPGAAPSNSGAAAPAPATTATASSTANTSGAPPSSGSGANSAATAQSANTPCRFFNLGQCNKGNQCPFLHKKAAHFSPQACKFYTNGFCRNGDACPFSHDRLPEKDAIIHSGSSSGVVSGTPSLLDDYTMVDMTTDGNYPLALESRHTGDFSVGDSTTTGSFDSSSFAGSFNEPHGLHEDTGSYHDAPGYFSRDSSSFEDDSASPFATISSEASHSNPSSGYLYLPLPHSPMLASTTAYGAPIAAPSSSSTSTVTSTVTSTAISAQQLHQLIHSTPPIPTSSGSASGVFGPHPTGSPRAVLSRRSSSEYLSSGSYSSNSLSSESPPAYASPSPLHVVPPPPGGVKLMRGAHITATTYMPLPAPIHTPSHMLNTGIPPSNATMSSAPMRSGTTSYANVPLDSSMSSVTDLAPNGAISASTNANNINANVVASSTTGPPAKPRFRRQTSAQFTTATASSNTNTNANNNIISIGSSINASNNNAMNTSTALILTPTTTSITKTGLNGVVSSGGSGGTSSVLRSTGLSSQPSSLDARPAPLNRSRSSDHGFEYRRSTSSLFNLYMNEDDSMGIGVGSGGAGSVGSTSLLQAAPIYPAAVPPIPLSHPTDAGMFDTYSNSSAYMEEYGSMGNITPSSTSSADPMFTRQHALSSGPSSTAAYLGTSSEFDSFSELGTSDEDDLMFWDNPHFGGGFSSSSGVGSAEHPRSAFSIAPMASVHHRLIEGILGDDDDDDMTMSISQSSSASATSETIPRSTISPPPQMHHHHHQHHHHHHHPLHQYQQLQHQQHHHHQQQYQFAHSGTSLPTAATTQSSLLLTSNMPRNRGATIATSGAGTFSSINPATSNNANNNNVLKGAFIGATTANTTLSPASNAGARATGPTTTASGGRPIPLLSRTRKGSFSKSHEELLANRDSSLSSSVTSFATTGAGFSSSVANTSPLALAASTSTIATALIESDTHSTSSSAASTGGSTTSSSYHAQPTASKRAVPPMIGSIKSASSVRLVMPSGSGGLGSGAGRIPPKMSKLGKSQSETATQLTSSIAAWKERKETPAPVGVLSLPLSSVAPVPSGVTSGSATPTSQLGSPSSTSSRKQQLCMFYIEGTCRYGDACKFVHGTVCQLCKKPCLFPDDIQQNEKHSKTCRLKLEIEESKDLVCSMCKLRVVENNRKFGILPECDDVVCVPCLKEFRASTSKAECPICQAPSHFLIPSHSFPQNPDRKREVTVAFKLKMSKIACKYFDHGNGVCKYGEHCHFHHQVDAASTPAAAAAPNGVTATTIAANSAPVASTSNASAVGKESAVLEDAANTNPPPSTSTPPAGAESGSDNLSSSTHSNQTHTANTSEVISENA